MLADSEVADAYRYCRDIANNHYENFPTASRLIQAELRPAVAAIYAFARHADDIADRNDRPVHVREKELEAWETLLERSPHQVVDHPILLALGDTVRRHDLPIELLHDLLTAFRMDLTIHRYSSVADLHYYCRYSANPVGRLMLALHGVDNPDALSASDDICSGLQLTNFWQDLCRDLADERCYLPLEWLQLYQLDHEQLLEDRADPEALRQALAHAISYTRGLFDRGERLLAYLPWRLRWQIAATLVGGRATLAAVERSPDPRHHRPLLTRREWILSLLSVVRTALHPARVSSS
ncbi:MAG: squalene synthase HpnC [Mariprofundales bacterium]|nr:squalene synthase HpnC [Mariprofundales bacterium]